MIQWILLLAAPILLSLAAAFFGGRVLKRNVTRVPATLRFVLANLFPVILVLAYLWIFQQIDFAIHRANGGSDEYMGPMAILVYGYPIFALTFIISFFLASYRFAES
ncbi:MAG: hypothetical protein AB3N06_04255 [Erythrobacter sp.]